MEGLHDKTRIMLFLFFIISPLIHCSQLGYNVPPQENWRKPAVIKKVELKDLPLKTKIILNRLGNYLYWPRFHGPENA